MKRSIILTALTAALSFSSMAAYADGASTLFSSPIGDAPKADQKIVSVTFYAQQTNPDLPSPIVSLGKSYDPKSFPDHFYTTSVQDNNFELTGADYANVNLMADELVQTPEGTLLHNCFATDRQNPIYFGFNGSVSVAFPGMLFKPQACSSLGLQA